MTTLFADLYFRWLIAQREWPNLDFRWEEPDGPPNEKLALRREFERRG